MFVGEEFCGQVVYEVGKNIYEIPCEGIIGNTVEIFQFERKLALVLCEVVVWGKEFETVNPTEGLL